MEPIRDHCSTQSPMQLSELRDRLFTILTFYRRGPATVTADSHLLADLNLDSLDLVQLANELEREFAIVINEADITAEHFATAARLESFIRHKIAAG